MSYVIVPRKVFPQESGNQPSKERSNSDGGDWYMRLVSVSEVCTAMTLTIQLCTLSSYGFSLLKSFIAINPLASSSGSTEHIGFQNSIGKKKGVDLQKQLPNVHFFAPFPKKKQVDQLLTWCSRIHLKGFMSSSSAILSHKCLLMSVIVSASSTASHLNPVLNHQTKRVSLPLF